MTNNPLFPASDSTGLQQEIEQAALMDDTKETLNKKGGAE